MTRLERPDLPLPFYYVTNLNEFLALVTSTHDIHPFTTFFHLFIFTNNNSFILFRILQKNPLFIQMGFDLHSVSVPFIETDSKFPPPVISLPESLSALTKLRVLYLSNLKLIEFPSFIQKLTNLEDLSLDRDNLKVIPDIFGSLTNLEDLDLAGNHLTSLPPSFQNLKSLKYINFQANPITRFPDCLKDLPALRDVTCDDTVTNIPSNNNIKFYFYKTSGSRDKKKKQILDRISPHSYYFSLFVDNPQFFPSADQILRCLSLLSKYHFTPLTFQEQPPTNARVKSIMEDIQQHPWDRLDTSPDLVLEIPLNPRSFLQIIQKIDEPYCPREVAESGTLLFVPTGLKGVMDDSPSPGWGSKFQILGTDLHNGEWETETIDFIENKFLAKYQRFLQEITDIVHNPVKIILDWED